MDNLELNEHQTSIVEQVAHYNSSDVNTFIVNTENHLEEQKKLNTVLNNSVKEEDIDSIHEFIDTNEPLIDDQLRILKELFSSLEKITEENKNLMNMKEEYLSLINSEQANKVAKKMRSIRKLKDTINSFLVEKGIIAA